MSTDILYLLPFSGYKESKWQKSAILYHMTFFRLKVSKRLKSNILYPSCTLLLNVNLTFSYRDVVVSCCFLSSILINLTANSTHDDVLFLAISRSIVINRFHLLLQLQDTILRNNKDSFYQPYLERSVLQWMPSIIVLIGAPLRVFHFRRSAQVYWKYLKMVSPFI